MKTPLPYQVMLLMLALVLAGCEILGHSDSSASLDAPLRITTDANTYEVDQTVTITVTNTSTLPVYRFLCMPIALEAFADRTRVATATYPVCLALGRVELAPGESYTDTFHIGVPTWYDAPFPINERHEYRVRMQFFRDADLEQPLPDDIVSTNFFQIR